MAILCSFSSPRLDAMTKAQCRDDGLVLAALKEAGRFSCWEVDDARQVWRTINRLEGQKLIVCAHSYPAKYDERTRETAPPQPAFPWALVTLTDAGEALLADGALSRQDEGEAANNGHSPTPSLKDTDEIREKVAIHLHARFQGMGRRAFRWDQIGGAVKIRWLNEADTILAILALSPPVDGGRGESARELRSSADAATTGSDQGSGCGTTRAKALLRTLVDALDAGQLEMNSPEVGEPEVGIPYHPWHEEWLHYARTELAEPTP